MLARNAFISVWQMDRDHKESICHEIVVFFFYRHGSDVERG